MSNDDQSGNTSPSLSDALSAYRNIASQFDDGDKPAEETSVDLPLDEVLKIIPEEYLAEPTTAHEGETAAVIIDDLYQQLRLGYVKVPLKSLAGHLPVSLLTPDAFTSDAVITMPLPLIVSAIDPSNLEKRISHATNDLDLASLPDPFTRTAESSMPKTEETPETPPAEKEEEAEDLSATLMEPPEAEEISSLEPPEDETADTIEPEPAAEISTPEPPSIEAPKEETDEEITPIEDIKPTEEAPEEKIEEDTPIEPITPIKSIEEKTPEEEAAIEPISPLKPIEENIPEEDLEKKEEESISIEPPAEETPAITPPPPPLPPLPVAEEPIESIEPISSIEPPTIEDITEEPAIPLEPLSPVEDVKPLEEIVEEDTPIEPITPIKSIEEKTPVEDIEKKEEESISIEPPAMEVPAITPPPPPLPVVPVAEEPIESIEPISSIEPPTIEDITEEPAIPLEPLSPVEEDTPIEPISPLKPIEEKTPIEDVEKKEEESISIEPPAEEPKEDVEPLKPIEPISIPTEEAIEEESEEEATIEPISPLKPIEEKFPKEEAEKKEESISIEPPAMESPAITPPPPPLPVAEEPKEEIEPLKPLESIPTPTEVVTETKEEPVSGLKPLSIETPLSSIVDETPAIPVINEIEKTEPVIPAIEPTSTETEEIAQEPGVAEFEKMGGINANTAVASQLMTIPGMNQKLADKIVAYRNEKGSFRDIFDLVNVSGLSRKTFKELTGMPYSVKRTHRAEKLAKLLKIDISIAGRVPEVVKALASSRGFDGCVISDDEGLILAESNIGEMVETISIIAPRMIKQMHDNMDMVRVNDADFVSISISGQLISIIQCGKVYLAVVHESNRMTQAQLTLMKKISEEIAWLLSSRLCVSV